MIFENRENAGKKLGSILKEFKGDNTFVLGLPRGGVPVAFEVARRLRAPLSVIISLKISSVHNKEFGIGAVSENNTVLFDKLSLELLNLTPNDLQEQVVAKRLELAKKVKMFRHGKSLPDFTGKVVILVDDGLATGVTALAAVEAIKKYNPKKIIFAVPVCAEQQTPLIEKLVDYFVCLYPTQELSAVGNYYENFSQVSDQEVKDLLKRSSKPAYSLKTHDGKRTPSEL